MKTITAEQAEIEAARNWCAGLLAGAGSQIEGDVAKRWVDIGVGILLSIYKDEEMSDEEKKTKCEVAYHRGYAEMRASPDTPHPSRCSVDGVEYIYCCDCPLYRG